jgi:NAD(P)-dependent dehydrogenase (short-subunit alcohol dehydrogenase family)
MDKQMIEKMKQQVPAGYIAEPDDVVPIIGFLAGQGASYITGQTIAVNGGRWFV